MGLRGALIVSVRRAEENELCRKLPGLSRRRRPAQRFGQSTITSAIWGCPMVGSTAPSHPRLSHRGPHPTRWFIRAGHTRQAMTPFGSVVGFQVRIRLHRMLTHTSRSALIAAMRPSNSPVLQAVYYGVQVVECRKDVPPERSLPICAQFRSSHGV